MAIPQVERLAEAFRIPLLKKKGWEADDLIGTVSRLATSAGLETYMVTPDKDFAQLVTPHVYMMKPARQSSGLEILGVEEICQQWEVERPEQVIDILGLWGDSSDNIPGVPGIGEKTAKKLITRFGDMETILNSTDQLKGKQKENLENFADQARLSRKLAEIDTKSPLDGLELDDLKLQEMDEPAVRELLSELEFSSIGQRLFGKQWKPARGAAKKAAAKTGQLVQMELFGGDEVPEAPETLDSLATVDHTYSLARDTHARATLINHLMGLKRCCFDTETDRLDALSSRLIGMSFAWKAHEAVYVSIEDAERESDILTEFAPVFAREDIEWVGHNLKFDLKVLRQKGVQLAAGCLTRWWRSSSSILRRGSAAWTICPSAIWATRRSPFSVSLARKTQTRCH